MMTHSGTSLRVLSYRSIGCRCKGMTRRSTCEEEKGAYVAGCRVACGLMDRLESGGFYPRSMLELLRAGLQY